MMLFAGKYISDIVKEDIERLIVNSVPESVQLDYKSELALNTLSDKKEFLADISAFGNSMGGIIVYGIEEKKDSNGKNLGIPNLVKPLININEDQLKQQIENIAQDGLTPSLTSLLFNFISFDNGLVIIIGVPENFGLPRMVSMGGSNKFYKRRNTGKYLLDVFELNDEFLKRDQMKTRLELLYEDRLKSLANGNSDLNLDFERFFFLSIFSINNAGLVLDFSKQQFARQLKELVRPVMTSGWEDKYNLEGYLLFAADYKSGSVPKIFSYTQVYRDGSLEFYTSRLHAQMPLSHDGRIDLLGSSAEDTIDDCFDTAQAIFDLCGFELNLYVKLTIVGLKDSRIINEKSPTYRGGVINRKELRLPGLLIHQNNLDESKLQLKDMLWQSGGFAQSLARDKANRSKSGR